MVKSGFYFFICERVSHEPLPFEYLNLLVSIFKEKGKWCKVKAGLKM